MQVKIKRIDKSLPLPEFHTKGAVGFDLYARTSITIEPAAIAIIPANLIVQVPEGYMLMLVSRSSTPRKKGLMKPHSIGIIDQDYCGETDELGIQVYNFTKETVTVDRGERIAQGIFVKVGIPQLVESDEVAGESRGGFGSTG
ncbi:dUTP diphosphatase [Candidatus Peregrinibacteria bacterium CG11_big_fil_rev_8_21_14_0_20_41_10]|nr:MAG: dUTP diphosphatase [Candidatus Peregrinibacteria bacterium CG11_big_fil_rev_8_21_14_0_20_41_10]PIZ74713.1 MAG: dUTP diphosphatase [Candidatus Peregrinibacteria bacterium CG_4_10_14_0_2_um_filter_41_8]PJC37910.1 MAG: dUTP diphosphatase [Candidatus Peregrinibacteria bacterium CG_4_9_14_0_2_um_filter_41_14]